MTATEREILLIDLSSIAYPIWHMNQGDPNPNSTSQKIVAKVRELAKDHPCAAICKDSGRSFRKDLTETYKANRPESDATLQHQIKLACTMLEHDGFPIWQAPGFEADDVLASAAQQSILQGCDVLIVSDDKDLMQLIGGPVRQFRPTRAVIYDAAKVKVEFNVEPGQIVDYLSLVGDTADNIYGANKIGPKTAAALLSAFDSMDGIYRALDEHPSKFKPACATSLLEFRPRVPLVRQLVELRYDAPIENFAQVLEPRKPAKPQTAFNVNALDERDEDTMDTTEQTTAQADGAPTTTVEPPTNVVDFASKPAATSTALAKREDAQTPDVLPAGFNLQPRNLKEARVISLDIFNSGMFSAYGTPEGVFTTIAFGQELGIPMMTALRQIHVIEGRHSLSAQLMVALVMRSGFAEYFEPVELSETKCTWTTHRKGSRNPFALTHTIEMAQQAGLVKDNSGWKKNPQDMLTARCSARLARMIYPDVVGNLYTPEELEEIRHQNTLAARAAGA